MARISNNLFVLLIIWAIVVVATVFAAYQLFGFPMTDLQAVGVFIVAALEGLAIYGINGK